MRYTGGSASRAEAGDAGNANIIKAIRNSVGYNIEELSLACGLSVSEITQMENGQEIDSLKLRRIISALHISEGDLATVFGFAEEIVRRP
jgi:transcriptional regulator with XRE-family HTH domain